LPTQISDLIDPELRHDGYYPLCGDIGQGGIESGGIWGSGHVPLDHMTFFVIMLKCLW
jgi:hypothetical protein